MNELDRIIRAALLGVRGPFFFVGSGKNAGKTTVLNAVNRVLCEDGCRVGVATIGHDGEAFDAILGHPKPPVELRAGNLACLTEDMARRAGSALRVLGPTGHETPVGILVLALAESDVHAEILGPETNARCDEVCRKMEGLGAQIVLVDGAFSRRTQIALRDGAALALVVSGDIAYALPEIETQVRHWVELFQLPREESVLSEEGGFERNRAAGDGPMIVRGPVTDERARALANEAAGRRIVIEDATKVFCDIQNWERLKAVSDGIRVLRTFDLKLIAANPTARLKPGFEPAPFAQALKRAAEVLPVIDVIAGIALD